MEGLAGSGTYVRGPARYSLPGPFLDLLPAGFPGTWEARSEPGIPAPQNIAARLDTNAAAPCVRTDYTLLATGRVPVLTMTSWEPMALTGVTPVVLPDSGPLAGRTVTERMAHIGITVERVIKTLTPVVLAPDQAARVSAGSGAPAPLISRTHQTSAGLPAETADVLVPAVHWNLVYEHRLNTGRGPDASAATTVSRA
ncbi:putative transcriptional regulator, GntR family [Actinobacteria bacterium OK074]|nr:putative transcriptional regulator, GntR family [Actinobacteria bacterium OK074]